MPEYSFESDSEDLSTLAPLDQVESMKNGLMARASGKFIDGAPLEYRTLRAALRKNPTLYAKLPSFVRTCSDFDQFWSFIQKKFPSYQERREFIWQSFAPAIDFLEANESNPGMVVVSKMLAQFSAEEVHATWDKALSRCNNDPEGAVTAARTLIETVCKHILDDAGIPYGPTEDLPKIWHHTAMALNLAPNQHQNKLLKAILGNCEAIVSNLAAIRNNAGDAHGQGRHPVKPTPRHAQLAVNLAGSMAAFLVATWLDDSRTSEQSM